MKMPVLPSGTEDDPAGGAEVPAMPAMSADNRERRHGRTFKASFSSCVTIMSASPATALEQSVASDAVTALACVVRMEIIGESATAQGPNSASSVVSGGGDLLLDPDGDEGRAGVIIGSGDRAHHLSLKLSQVTVVLRQQRLTTPLIASRAPLSRVECQRRCGAAGFCDPASELGCGGEYCCNRYDF